MRMIMLMIYAFQIIGGKSLSVLRNEERRPGL